VTRKNWVWIQTSVLYAVHGEQLAEHGGASGIRDESLFESALARPQNLAVYENPDIAALAASYGYGIARNHPFVDGNKRTGFVAVELFLNLNGFELNATDEACVLTMLDVAAGQITEDAFADWIRKNMVKESK
jgi:death on curing protein